MTVRLPLHNIQGNIVPGFRKDYQAFVFARFWSGPAGQRWLAEVLPDVATAEEVATFNRLFKQVRRRRPGRETSVIQAAWINVSFSSEGLRLLAGEDAVAGFSRAFQDGLYRRAADLGDAGTFRDWVIGNARETEPHVFLLVAADDRADFERELQRQLRRLRPHVAWRPAVFQGNVLPEGREHFGYRDGVSQPDDYDLLEGWVPDGEAIAPGEFVLGYPKEGDDAVPDGPAWAKDGSYVVFRRLAQHVGRFRGMQQLQAGPKSALTPARLAAKVVGRWSSGARLADETSDPGLGKAGRALEALWRLDPDGFRGDDTGERCPLFSHVRRAHPRGAPGVETWRHRLIRRGIPYGPPFRAGEVDDGSDRRGLLFLSYQASIERQFEHVQRLWLNRPDSPWDAESDPGPDPLVGQPAGGRAFRLRQKGEPEVTIELDRFVTVTGGGYYFAPSIDALSRLADRHASVMERGQNMAETWPAGIPGNVAANGNGGVADDDLATQLGRFILEQIPYGRSVLRSDRLELTEAAYAAEHDAEAIDDAPLKLEGPLKRMTQSRPVDEDADYGKLLTSNYWYFGGRARRVTKAMRLKITYPNPKGGADLVDHILIGYEGSGGDN